MRSAFCDKPITGRRSHHLISAGSLPSILLLCLLIAGGVMPSAARADNTGELFPAAASGDFSSSTDALSCNNAVASADNNGDAESFSNYGLSLPPTAIITGIQVRVRANDGSLNNRKLRISLSSTNGMTFTAPLATRNFRRNSALRDYIVGGSTVLWGRTWTAADFANGVFQVRALAPKASNGSPVNLDCIPVTVFYRLPGAPNLNLSKTDSPDPVQPGQNITYTIAYSNTGESTATNVVVSDTVPANTTFVSASPAPTSAPAVGGTGPVTWNVGSVASGGSGVVTLVVKTGAALLNGTVITNASYSIDSDQNTPTDGNPATTTVSGTIALTLSKTDSPDPVAPGGALTYVLTIGNSGTGTSSNIIVNESFDGNVTYVAGSYSSTCAGITESGDTDGQWVIPTLASGSPPCTITINTTVTTPLADGVLLFNSADIVDAANSTAEASAITTVMNPVVCGDSIVGAGEACDLGTGVNGSSGACCTASCQLRAAGETCRAVTGVCDAAETCTGASPTCPADAKSASVCRTSAGICDVPEVCDGASNDCPTDLFVPGGTECRASAGVCDPAESCTGSGSDCPVDAKSSASCRASAGACDPAESCDGVGNDCPADARSTATCRAAAGTCDVAEVCDGVGVNCPADIKSTGVCRPAGGVCDVAESCDGVGNACPSDTKSTATCRTAAGICDVAEVCDGLDNACPADQVLPNGTGCRASVGVCDESESCDGVGTDCPADEFVASGTQCRAAADVCDVAEACTGSGPDCPADGFQPATTVCRASSVGEVCDVPESCTGSGPSCPPDAVEPNTTVCRAAAGVCDVVETCDGSGKVCPPDAVQSTSTVCRASSVGEVCDVPESCDGTNVTCPADAVLPNGTSCRASAGVCDPAEACNGTAKTCPADAKSSAPCRAAAGVCDVAESCDGVNDDCPANAFVANGTSCDDSNYCNGTQACTNGVCGGGTSPCAMGQSCDEATDSCFAGNCPVAAVACRTATKNKVLIKNKSDDGKDKLIWKWAKGAETTQAEFGDPTATASYALCIYAGATPTLLQGAQVPPAGGRWSVVGSKGYKYTDATGSNAGITKIIVKGGGAGKSKALVKGRGAGLPDFDSDLPIDSADLPLIVQLRNNSSGLCWEGSFATAKKNQADQFNAKTP